MKCRFCSVYKTKLMIFILNAEHQSSSIFKKSSSEMTGMPSFSIFIILEGPGLFPIMTRSVFLLILVLTSALNNLIL